MRNAISLIIVALVASSVMAGDAIVIVSATPDVQRMVRDHFNAAPRRNLGTDAITQQDKDDLTSGVIVKLRFRRSTPAYVDAWVDLRECAAAVEKACIDVKGTATPGETAIWRENGTCQGQCIDRKVVRIKEAP